MRTPSREIRRIAETRKGGSSESPWFRRSAVPRFGLRSAGFSWVPGWARCVCLAVTLWLLPVGCSSPLVWERVPSRRGEQVNARFVPCSSGSYVVALSLARMKLSQEWIDDVYRAPGSSGVKVRYEIRVGDKVVHGSIPPFQGTSADMRRVELLLGWDRKMSRDRCAVTSARSEA